jgi:hypothetical protein
VIANRSRVAKKDLTIKAVRRMSEQELRFVLTRYGIERRILDHLHGRRLLVLACSARKTAAAGPVRAWERYDGVAYRLIKKLQREGKLPADIDIWILSAKHGLIPSDRRIAAYDTSMNAAIAKAMRQATSEKLKELVGKQTYRKVMLAMGREYLGAVGPRKAWASDGAVVSQTKGRIGEQLSQLRKWILEAE